jgi:N-acetylmuramate 1-kinase
VARGQQTDPDLLATLGPLVAEALGAEVVSVAQMTGGLGTRRFFRVALASAPGSLVARIEAPEDPAGRPAGAPPEPPLEPLRSFLEAAGIPVPARYGGDPARGIDLLEDLGSVSLADAVAVAAPAERAALYQATCDLIPRLQALRDPQNRIPAFRRRLDAALFDYKADLFARLSLPLALGRAARADEVSAVCAAFRAVAERCAEVPARLAHRDLQSHNVMVRREAGGRPRVVLIDLQGAFLAAPEYDLVCLLRDSYVELPEAEVEAHLARVRAQLPDSPEPAAFRERFDLLTLTRKAKDHARFVHAASVRGERRTLRHLPATVRALRGAARRTASLDPRLRGLAAWIEALPISEEVAPCAP